MNSISNGNKNMTSIFTGSVVLKGIGAVLEILVQILITRSFGVSGYGDYSFYVGLADLAFWILFSAIVKCNVYYLSANAVSIGRFRKKYYCLFVLPVFLISVVAGVIFGNLFISVSAVILFAEFVFYDKSSQFLAKRYYSISLVGEYILGRIVLLLSITALLLMGDINLLTLLVAYVVQFVVVDIYFVVRMRKVMSSGVGSNVREEKVSLRKVWRFQESDIVTALIGQAPVVLQYIASGAFSAGIVSIVSLVRRMVNFFSGPAAKVFLPEFARCCEEGKPDEARSLYSQIVRIQMLFVSVAAVVLIGFPNVVLLLFSSDLAGYENVLRGTSACFLIATILGPAGGLLQMAGKEKAVSTTKNISAAIMIVVWIALSQNDLFVLYGICIELLLETAILYVLVTRYLKALPLSPVQYVRLLAPTVIALMISPQFSQNPILGVVVLSVAVAAVQIAFELRGGLFSGLIKRGRND